MLGVGADLDQNGIIVCQINVEVHFGKHNFKSRFAAIVKGILVDQRYVIIRTLSVHHQRIFLLNVEIRKCIEKYVAQFFM
ncbi:unnamed protein product [Strongylus vulgaris]|uniref:Uncharacterized protein n=1 Tax=Strongylus vulgaris TaxID=40348 RepID=A0A3P7JJ10_STRVU|nr:unnamed protein product [Strongylus vulgaris]